MIRPIAISDISRAAEIHVFAWRSAYRGIISDEYLFKTRSVAGSLKRFEDTVRDGTPETYVYDDGIVKAFLTIGICRNEDKPNAFELGAIYVDPFMQGQGIGRQLAEFCEKQAVERGFNEICLWVLKENWQSRGFYEKMGYVADGSEEFLERLSAWQVRYTRACSH